MKDYLKVHPWKIIEEGFHLEHNKVSESIFSLGNGRMGQRANFEEHFSGPSLQGNYVGGVYYPDKTIVGWWKNGYPEYYAKVLNAADWNIIDIYINGERLDLAKNEVLAFRRELDMKSGILSRTCDLKMGDGTRVSISSKRINSLEHHEVGVISYSLKVIEGKADLKITPIIDFNVRNEDANYEENFWHKYNAKSNKKECCVSAFTKKTEYRVAAAQTVKVTMSNDVPLSPVATHNLENFVGLTYECSLENEASIKIEKFAAILSSMNHHVDEVESKAILLSKEAADLGFAYFVNSQQEAWSAKWNDIDIEIEGDEAAQQGIRFNIFQLHQTYSGDDLRLNIGPKGFTGERYGGSTYWDTEAYCLPFYMSTADERVAEALLLYRYEHLGKAIENAASLGLKNGAALYPMVTMNGEECHNEWEITFEEIHRNGAIAYAIFDYIRYTGKSDYLNDYGLEVLIGISRFWAERIHFSTKRQKYVMMGVTGPNEYENNVNNNWYTNYIATWTLRYTLECMTKVSTANPEAYAKVSRKLKFQEDLESRKWKEIIEKMYYPYDEELGIFLQQDNYLDKEQILVSELKESDLPLNQNWSWDRILRSCFIKQADVLQGLFFFEDEFDEATHRRNFLFYEPRTVHESSLSPCVHSILASKLDMKEKAYEMYLRTARLDLNDYNNDTEDGLHITSMAGTWMSVVKGFGGMEIKNGVLTFEPKLPDQWKSFSFKIKFRGTVIKVAVNEDHVVLQNLSSLALELKVSGHLLKLEGNAIRPLELATA